MEKIVQKDLQFSLKLRILEYSNCHTDKKWQYIPYYIENYFPPKSSKHIEDLVIVSVYNVSEVVLLINETTIQKHI